ncbi:MAG TPA: Hsp20/alpha crystallin family protein [Terriglobales bacterium]|nr:Hsp20/alpha crystallin family protein [Terriglobales bacterium]
MNQDSNELGFLSSGDVESYFSGPLPDIDKFDERTWGENRFSGFRVDVRDTEDAYIIEAEMPGLEKDDIDINADDDTLTISARYDENTEQKDDEGNYIQRERRAGAFRRSFTLENIQENEVTAEMASGILTVRCPKKTDDGGIDTRKVKIK